LAAAGAIAICAPCVDWDDPPVAITRPKNSGSSSAVKPIIGAKHRPAAAYA
jgi:hypothetical protein